MCPLQRRELPPFKPKTVTAEEAQDPGPPPMPEELEEEEAARVLFEGTEEEQASARKIQAVQRGRQVRPATPSSVCQEWKLGALGRSSLSSFVGSREVPEAIQRASSRNGARQPARCACGAFDELAPSDARPWRPLVIRGLKLEERASLKGLRGRWRTQARSEIRKKREAAEQERAAVRIQAVQVGVCSRCASR